MNRLAYVQMKGARAQVHLDALNREIGIYLRKPYTRTRNDDVEKGWHIVRTEQTPVPPFIGMLLGEFLYCLRSGLNQAAWHLALPSARQKTPRKIQFPVAENNALPWFIEALSMFPTDVAREIDLLQPYHGSGSPQDHPLWQLNFLSNFDKHKSIPLASTSFPIFVPVNPAVRVEEFEYAIEVSVPIADKKDLDFEPGVPSEIEFGEWKGDTRIPRHRLADIQSFVTCTVIPKLANFFSDTPDSPLSRADLIGPVYE